MNNKNKFVILSFAIILNLIFCGCQLAIESAVEEKANDRLVGMWVTFEPIYSLARESVDIEEILMNGNKSYDTKLNKIFATKDKSTYVFPDVEGMYFFYEKVYSDDYNMTVLHGDEGFSDASVNGSDESGELSATIYYCEEDNIFYLNPIYQTSDGKIYTMPGEGISGGDGVTTTITESFTFVKDGEKVESESSVAIKLDMVDPIEKVVIKQMGENDQVVEITEITRYDIPESIYVKSDTAYIIAENHDDLTGIERVMIKPEEDSYACKFANDKGILVEHRVDLVYKNAEKQKID